MRHIGIAAVTAEGASIVYRHICAESEKLFGPYVHPEITLHTFSFSEHIFFGEDRQQKWSDLLIKSISKLKKSGADFVICPSNTTHEVYEFVCSKIDIPWLNIASCVERTANRVGLKKLLLLGTSFTMNSNVYNNAFQQTHVELVTPNDEEKEYLHTLITEKLIRGEVSMFDQKRIETLINNNQKLDVDGVILGCTELPLIINNKITEISILDSTKILGDAAIELASKDSV